MVYSVLEDSGLTSLHVHHSSEGSYSNSYWNLLLPFIPVLAVKGECEELSESSQTPKGLRTTNTDRYPLWATRTSLEVISMQTFKTVCNPQWWERRSRDCKSFISSQSQNSIKDASVYSVLLKCLRVLTRFLWFQSVWPSFCWTCFSFTFIGCVGFVFFLFVACNIKCLCYRNYTAVKDTKSQS